MPRRNPFKSKILLYVGLTVAGVAAAGGGIFGPNTSTVAGTTTTTAGTTTIVSGTCSVADASGCNSAGAPGTYVTFTNPTHPDAGSASACSVVATPPASQPACFWVNCNTNLLSYAQHTSSAGFHQDGVVTGSGWPVHLVFHFTTGLSQGFGAEVKLTSGCVGQGNGSIDLVTNIDASPTLGGIGEDVVKIDRSAGCPTSQLVDDPSNAGNCTGINIAGNANGGPKISGAHADCVQLIGGDHIGFYDFQAGDWASKTPTCIGDGAGLYINAAVPSVNSGGTCNTSTAQFCANKGWVIGLTVKRMRMVTCNHGISTQVLSQSGVVNGQNATGTVTNSMFRAGQTTQLGGIPNCGASGGAMGKSTGTTAASYDGAIRNMVADAPGFTFGSSNVAMTDVRGDNWCQTGCVWSPGFNPAYDNVPF